MTERQDISIVQADQKSQKQVQIIEKEIAVAKKESPLCESCVRDVSSVREGRFDPKSLLVERMAEFLCFTCEMYECLKCLPGHESHEGMRVGRKESVREEIEASVGDGMEEQSSSERMKSNGKGFGKKSKRIRLEEEREEEGEKSESDRMEEEEEKEKRKDEKMEEGNEGKLTLLLDDLMNESKIERIEKFDNCHVSIYDRVYVKHELDPKNCWITGLCGLENLRWVVCDYSNSCVKIFSLGSNLLQRYIRFVESEPWGVTEILVNQNSSESNSVSGSSGVSVTDRAEQEKQFLIAVTLPGERQVMLIDVSKAPALIHKIIFTEEKCYHIRFHDDKIFTVCEGLDSLCSVYIKSTDGVTLKKFDTGIYDLPGPYLAVGSGRVYLTDVRNNKVHCRNFEGQVISEITIEGSGPLGTSLDPDNNFYVCSRHHNKVYKLDPDLIRYKSVLDQTAGYIEYPRTLCYYRDKLFVSHGWPPSLRNFVTVVRLL